MYAVVELYQCAFSGGNWQKWVHLLQNGPKNCPQVPFCCCTVQIIIMSGENKTLCMIFSETHFMTRYEISGIRYQIRDQISDMNSQVSDTRSEARYQKWDFTHRAEADNFHHWQSKGQVKVIKAIYWYWTSSMACVIWFKSVPMTPQYWYWYWTSSIYWFD